MRPRRQAPARAWTLEVRRQMSAGCVASLSSVVWVATSRARGRISVTCGYDVRGSEYLATCEVEPIGPRYPWYPPPPTPSEVSLLKPAACGLCCWSTLGTRSHDPVIHLHGLQQDSAIDQSRPLPALPAVRTCRAEREARRPHWSHDTATCSASPLQELTGLAQAPAHDYRS